MAMSKRENHHHSFSNFLSLAVRILVDMKKKGEMMWKGTLGCGVLHGSLGIKLNGFARLFKFDGGRFAEI